MSNLAIYMGALTLLNRTLPSQNLLYRKELNPTLLNQETDITEFTKTYSTELYSAKPVSGICLTRICENRTLLKQKSGIC